MFVIPNGTNADNKIVLDLENDKFIDYSKTNILQLPISLYGISDETKEQNNGYTGDTYGQFKTQGTFLYKLKLQNGFEYRDIITHISEKKIQKYDYLLGSPSINCCPNSYLSYVTRSLYFENILYTISDDIIKIKSLADLKEINCVKLE
jgi:hypothetical protein